MRTLFFLLALLPILLLPAVPAAEAAELGGVQLDDTTKVDGQRLVLNGIGMRKKAIFKVYVAGLYLPAKQSQPSAILAEDGPRHLTMEFVRNVSASQLSGAWDDCLEGNVPDASVEIKKGFASLNDWMADVGSGDRLSVTYVPGTGTEIEVKGSVQGTVEGKDFADAMFSCWLGPAPPSGDLKDGLLGK